MVTPVGSIMSVSGAVSPVRVIAVAIVIVPVWIPSPRVTPTERGSPSPAIPTETYVVAPRETVKTRIVPDHGPNVFRVIAEN